MSDLTEFLLARIADDEADVRAEYVVPELSVNARRARAECEAKRRIVERIFAYQGGTRDDLSGDWMGDDVLALLALPYAEHPDYNPEWRP